MDLFERLAPNFTLGELVKSDTAARKGIDNTPDSPEVIDNLRAVAQMILQPVRAAFGQPVVVNSGSRGPKLNKAVGGSTKSQHMTGCAVDFEIPGVANEAVARWVAQNLVFDQLILEFHTPGVSGSGWVHASFRRDGHNRQQVLTVTTTGETLQGIQV